MPHNFLRLFLSASALLFFACAAFAGEICKECHPDIIAKHVASLHGKAGKDCESCHGAATDHLGNPSTANIISFAKKGDVIRQNAQCLSCHASNHKLMAWDFSVHKREDVACASCHSIHKSPRPDAGEPGVCFVCHRDIRSKANNFSHHPIIEGKVKCSDCHNAHGTMSKAMIRDESINQLCYKCHSDKRGPFVWEHPPVTENCLNCHNPHGAKTGRLLNEKIPSLCQNCHANSGHPSNPFGSGGGFNGPQKAAQFYGRSCLNCHGNIHGSSAPSGSGENGGDLFTR